MPRYIEKPTITTLRLKIRPEAKTAFVDWQAKLNAKIVGLPGFVSLEFLAPSRQYENWLIVQRFSDTSSAAAWQQSKAYLKLNEELKVLTVSGETQEDSTDELNIPGGVTEVIVAEVRPKNQQAYREWSAKIHQVEAQFPGFRGVYVQAPSQGQGHHWITLLQFDTMENLDRWLESSERKDILSESGPFITSLETHRVISPYAGWFASIARVGEVPSVWKQTMLVLLILFPIVMLELKYLSPLTNSLNLSLSTFIGNAISVTLISFPMMPIAIWCLGWWLSPGSKNRLKRTILGTVLVCGLYLLEIAIFWNLLA